MCEGSHSPREHVVISVVLVAFLAALVAANVPLSGFHRSVKSVDDPVQRATGARQVWSVFAPDPNQVVAQVSVRFSYRDGTTATWRVPRGGALLHSYRDYRWLKLAENSARSEQAAQGLLLWAVHHQAGPRPLAHADLLRSVYDIAPAGRPRTDHARPQTGLLLSLVAR